MGDDVEEITERVEGLLAQVKKRVTKVGVFQNRRQVIGDKVIVKTINISDQNQKS